MTKFKLTILMLLITAFGVVVSGCIKKTQPAANANKNVNTATTILGMPDQARSLVSYGLDDFDLKLVVKDINCSNFIKYNQPTNVLLGYCRKKYNNNLIQEKDLLVEISKSDDQIFMDNDFEYLHGLFPEADEQFLKESSRLYNKFVSEVRDKYRVSVYLVDDVGKDEMARFYVTKNVEGVSEKELYYWNICEAACPVYSKKIVGNYILWQWGINPSSGAGDMCLRVSEPYEKYSGDKQIKCEIIANIDRMSNSIFSMTTK